MARNHLSSGVRDLWKMVPASTSLALRAHKAVRPAHRDQRRMALFLGAGSGVEFCGAHSLLEFHRIACHFSVPSIDRLVERYQRDMAQLRIGLANPDLRRATLSRMLPIAAVSV